MARLVWWNDNFYWRSLRPQGVGHRCPRLFRLFALPLFDRFDLRLR